MLAWIEDPIQSSLKEVTEKLCMLEGFKSVFRTGMQEAARLPSALVRHLVQAVTLVQQFWMAPGMNEASDLHSNWDLHLCQEGV